MSWRYIRVKGPRNPQQSVSTQRKANVLYANSLLDTEINQRNARKDSQENTARWIVASTGLTMTLLLGLAKDAGVFSPTASVFVRAALVVTVALGSISAGCAIACLWPRKYDRLGLKALSKFNNKKFLDSPEHEVMGQIVSTRISIASTMDKLHERKANWLKWSFRFLACAFLGLLLQGAALAIDPPVDSSAEISSIGRNPK